MHRSIGGMHFLTSNKKTCVGTGVLISKDLLLTAAHNIYNNILQTENTEFRFYLGSNGVEYNYNQF